MTLLGELSMEQTERVLAARRHRAQRDLSATDFLRDIRDLTRSMTQTEVARCLGLTQSAVSQALKTAAKIAEVPDGFSGASVPEIIQRYTAGDLTRDQLIDELSRWPFKPMPDPVGPEAWDWSAISYDGTTEELVYAIDAGAIDRDIYAAVFARRHGHGSES